MLRGWRAAPQVVAPRVAGRNVRSIFTLIVIFLAQPALGSQASVPGCFFCANDLCLLAFSFWRPAQRLLCICCIAASFVHLLHRSGFCASAALQRLLRICCIAASSVHLLHCSVFCGAASSSVQTSASLHPPAASPASNIFPMALRRSAPRPATNLTRRRRSSVWLAIWRTWAGFANSQHRDAAFATPDNICAHSSLLPHWAAAQTDANLSAHLHRLPTPPPYLRRMRLLPGRVRGCWVLDETFANQGLRCWVANDAASCPWRSSCKSPRARIPVLGTSGAHWPARWPRFELTEHVDKS